MRNLIFWLLSCFLITLFCGLIFATGQQVIRQAANDPQTQMAEDMALLLSTGKNPVDVIPKDTIDTSRSLAPFLVIYDKNGKLLATNAQFQNASDTPPQGVFDFQNNYRTDDLISLFESYRKKDAFRQNEKFITWQPGPNARFASIIVKYNDGYVLAGRSLREVETRTEAEFHFIFMVWVIGIGATSLAFFLASRIKK